MAYALSADETHSSSLRVERSADANRKSGVLQMRSSAAATQRLVQLLAHDPPGISRFRTLCDCPKAWGHQSGLNPPGRGLWLGRRPPEQQAACQGCTPTTEVDLGRPEKSCFSWILQGDPRLKVRCRTSALAFSLHMPVVTTSRCPGYG